MTASLLSLFALLVVPAGNSAAWFHVPHERVNAIAVAPHSGGGNEVVMVSNLENAIWQTFRSVDEGVSWQILSGEGLENERAVDVVYHPEWPADDKTTGLFLIGTTNGVWAYHPSSGRVERFSDGLNPADIEVLKLAVPLEGSLGPALLVTHWGRVWRRFPGDSSWTLVLEPGTTDRVTRASVAISPHFDLNSPPSFRVVAASVNDRLHFSEDGGDTWEIHAQFDRNPNQGAGLVITDLAFAEDFSQSGEFLMTRGREDHCGEIWRSADYGKTFTQTHFGDDELVSIVGTPAGPGGQRRFLASPERNPFREGGTHTGILVSTNGGQSWSDNGNPQDFNIRSNREGSTPGKHAYDRRGFGISADYATDGVLYNGREQGLVRSKDEGLHWAWITTRPESEVRGFDVTLDDLGEPVVFTASYGTGVIRHGVVADDATILNAGLDKLYTRLITASPNYATDGTVLLSALEGVRAWFDPDIPPANPFAMTGWFELPLAHPTLNVAAASPRVIALSTKYNSGGGVGFDQTMLMSAEVQGQFPPPIRSSDAGVTSETVEGRPQGGQWYLVKSLVPPFFRELKIAPTYDGSSQQTRSDVYGTEENGAVVYKLTQDSWQVLGRMPANAQRIAIDPEYARPGNPRIFVSTIKPSVVVEILDEGVVPGITVHSAGLEDVFVWDLAVPSGFSQDPVIYVCSLASGILKIDLDEPSPSFAPVGDGYPPLYTKGVAVSPDYANDRLVFAATSEGVWALEDLPGNSWYPLRRKWWKDDKNAAVHPFAPNDPANPDDSRTWKWRAETDFPSRIEVCGGTMVLADYDESYLRLQERARYVRFHTIGGPGSGSVELLIKRLSDGAVLHNATVDLEPVLALQDDYVVEVDLGAVENVSIRATAHLDAGESVAFDGFEFEID